jgi:outer membrane protein assembly factor BamB
LFCLDAAAGKEVWKTDILKATGAPDRSAEARYWGLTSSPLVEGDAVIVLPGGTKNNAVAAFHKDTGKLVWGAGDASLGYSSPVAVTLAGRRQVVAAAGKAVLGIDPAGGAVLWQHPFGNLVFDCTCATPLCVDNRVFVSAAYGVGCALLEVTADGDKLAVGEKWKNRDLQNHFATSILLDGHLYGCHGDLGACTLRCVELETGKVKWSEREPGKCSLVAAGGRLICLSETGAVRVVEANPEKYVVRGELTDLLTFKSWPAPVIADGRLYLRDEKHLICLDLRRE